jgi:RNA polymerase sigma-70 factor (ECF subfamily)
MFNEKDKNLMERIINRDERAFYSFYQTNKNSLFNFIYRQIKNRQDAEEVLQDSFLAFIEGLRDFREQSSLKTFLFSIARRKIIDKIRKKKIKRILFSHLPKKIIESLTSVLLDEEIDRRFLIKKIDKVFERLPNDYALILRLKYKEGYPVVEIAKKLKLSFSAAESLLFRARQAFIKLYGYYENQELSIVKQKTQRNLLSSCK